MTTTPSAVATNSRCIDDCRSGCGYSATRPLLVDVARPVDFRYSGTVEQRRSVITAIPGPKSSELWERRTRAIPAAVGTTLPVFVADAEGSIIEDVDGNRFIDLGAGIA